MASRDGGTSGRGRSSAHPATAAARAATAQPAHRAAEREGRTARAPVVLRGTVGTGWLGCGPGAPNASLNSLAEPQRSAGSFCSAVRIAASMAADTVGRLVRSGGACSVSTLATMAWELGPVKGGSPASIS